MHEGCKYFVWPRHNAEFWKRKIQENAARDRKNRQRLKEQGWKVLIVWECSLKDAQEETLELLKKQILYADK